MFRQHTLKGINLFISDEELNVEIDKITKDMKFNNLTEYEQFILEYENNFDFYEQ
ncbi:hypothetical protein H312_01171 [Anncaliia algerae PRA339]|uniref:Uncharacterized protein n=1 Tax=Anncaliia algerae PRA339 TaxID=1288291 RepID=A0A059F369_9MICR|nr:hypothetical protein H312_01171 [Anncaliia algerae PRA339]